MVLLLSSSRYRHRRRRIREHAFILLLLLMLLRKREREREDVSHRESKKRDDTFSTERARTRKGVRGKEVLLLRRRLPPLYLRKAHHHVFVFNPQQEE